MYIPLIIWLIWRKTAYVTIIVALLFGSLFYFTTTERNKLPEKLPQEMLLEWTTTVNVKGRVVRGFMKDTEGHKIYVSYKIQSEDEKRWYTSQSLVGKQFFAKGELTTAKEPYHEFAFNMADYLKSHRAIGIYEVESFRFIRNQTTFTTVLSEQRFKINKQIENYFPKSLVSEAKALLIGDQQDVDPQQQRAYQKLGITHLFAISGLHVALVSILFQQLLLRMGVRKESVFFILFIALPSYAIIAGGAPSVWRSVMTVLVVMLAQAIRFKIPLESAISLCFIFFVVIEPNMIFQVGFQLSFLATLAIILSARYLATLSTWYSISFWITFACQLLVSPLLLYHFYEISLSSFLMNLLFVPLFSYVILPINLILLLFSYVLSPLFYAVITIYEPIRMMLTKSILWLQSIPYQMWNPGRPSIVVITVLFLVVLLLFYLFEIKKFQKSVILVLVTFCLFVTFSMTRHEELRITFLSVGQGDSTLIELPNRQQVYLIDSGGLLRFSGEAWKQYANDYEVGRQVIVPYLKGRGIKGIDRMILTHADADHVEGAEEVMQEVAVREIHISPNSAAENVMADLKEESVKQGIPIKEKLAGDGWQSKGVTFQYFMPKDLDYEGNNDSLVIAISYRGYRVIIPGDLEKEGEQELVQKNASDVANTTILKAGHHGSKTSTSQEFLDVVNPQLIIYSTGFNNRYNHPAQEVVDRVNEAGIPSFNTATDGTIQLQINEQLIIKKGQQKYELSK